MISANLPWVESPFFEEILKTKELTHDEIQLVREYNRCGYVVLPGFISEDLINSTLHDAEIKGFNPDFKIKTQRDETRVQDLWKVSEPAKRLAIYKPLLDKLQLLYDREPVPFQTLNFKVGTQQRAHSDTIHFSSLPARFMCGAWVALEDITEENGPVFYYPGSHRLPEYNFAHIRNEVSTPSYANYKEYEDFIDKVMASGTYEKKKFLAKKGDLLIWSSNIIHGGSPVTKPTSTRWSQVTHYFFKDCFYYTPMLSNMVTNELYLRNNLVNIATGQPVEQTYNGQAVQSLKSAKNLYTLNNSFKRLFGSLFLRKET
jgi:hypothetical protein